MRDRISGRVCAIRGFRYRLVEDTGTCPLRSNGYELFIPIRMPEREVDVNATKRPPAILIMTAAIGIQIAIGTEIDEKARNSTPIAIAISISTVQMCHN
jgi:hypothetical protein